MKQLRAIYSKYPDDFLAVSVVIALIVALFIVGKCQARYEERVLKNSIETWAIYSEYSKTVGVVGEIFYFFNMNGDSISFRQNIPARKVVIGDTVRIKYAIEDNDVARVISYKY